MVSLDTTTRWVVMLLVAGGVGLIGGIAAALLEMKVNFNAKPPNTGRWLLNAIVCVFVGGVAAVAAIYFFLPVKEVLLPGGGKPESFYELTKLVPLSLIIGSAGTYFLQSFQKRIKDAVDAQTGREAVASNEATAEVAEVIPKNTAQSLEKAGAKFQVALTDAGVEESTAKDIVPQLVKEAKEAAGEAILPQLDSIQLLTDPSPTPNIAAARQERLKDFLKAHPEPKPKPGPEKPKPDPEEPKPPAI